MQRWFPSVMPSAGTVKLTYFLEVPLIDMPAKSLIYGAG